MIAAFDFFTVPTVTFQLRYCFFVIEHGRRKVLHFNVTRHPTAEWVLQQLREAFPEAAPYRYVILDRDSKFDADVIKFLKATAESPCGRAQTGRKRRVGFIAAPGRFAPSLRLAHSGVAPGGLSAWATGGRRPERRGPRFFGTTDPTSRSPCNAGCRNSPTARLASPPLTASGAPTDISVLRNVRPAADPVLATYTGGTRVG